jgi:hypothetical protein
MGTLAHKRKTLIDDINLNLPGNNGSVRMPLMVTPFAAVSATIWCEFGEVCKDTRALARMVRKGCDGR